MENLSFYYVHLLFANFVCLPFGAGQIVYSGFIRAFLLETAAFCRSKLADESSEGEPKH